MKKYFLGINLMQYMIVTFYKFATLNNIYSLQSTLKQLCKEQGIVGTILLAEEGINSTLAGKGENINAILLYLRSLQPLSNLKCTYSYANILPFKKTKILIKKEIVALKVAGIDPGIKAGIPVTPEAWNDLISEPDVTVIDTRNTYEIELGTFKGALNPKTRKFRDFPAYVKANLDPAKHKKIAIFCTGGIRCEKASSYLLEQGFENVYQLQGGILKYLEKIEPKNSLWEGKCFIFDNRITLEEDNILH